MDDYGVTALIRTLPRESIIFVGYSRLAHISYVLSRVQIRIPPRFYPLFRLWRGFGCGTSQAASRRQFEQAKERVGWQGPRAMCESVREIQRRRHPIQGGPTSAAISQRGGRKL